MMIQYCRYSLQFKFKVYKYWQDYCCILGLSSNYIYKHFLQVLLLRFNFCLTQANLSSQFRDINIGYYVTQILDAVCHAYNEEDCLLLQTFCDFLKDLSNESRYRIDLEKSITLEFIQQIFLVLDCSQGIFALIFMQSNRIDKETMFLIK